MPYIRDASDAHKCVRDCIRIDGVWLGANEVSANHMHAIAAMKVNVCACMRYACL